MVILPEGCQALLFQLSGMFLANLASNNASQQLRVCIDLGYPNRGIGSMKGVVVVLVVFECLAKRRGTVKAYDSELPKCLDILAARDPQKMKLRVRFPHGTRCLETGEDVACLQRNEASEGNVPIAQLLERLHGECIGFGTPSLRNSDWREAILSGLTIAAGTVPPTRRSSPAGLSSPEALDRGRPDADRIRPDSEDHMVHREAIIEAALLIEVCDFCGGVGRPFFPNVSESAAVAHRFEIRILQAEILPHSDTHEPVPLRSAVFPGPAAEAIDDRLRHQDPVIGGFTKQFMRIAVVALPDALTRSASPTQNRMTRRRNPGCPEKRISSRQPSILDISAYQETGQNAYVPRHVLNLIPMQIS